MPTNRPVLSIEAFVLLTAHVPPGTVLVSSTGDHAHMLSGPVMVPLEGKASTVMVASDVLKLVV